MLIIMIMIGGPFTLFQISKKKFTEIRSLTPKFRILAYGFCALKISITSE